MCTAFCGTRTPTSWWKGRLCPPAHPNPGWQEPVRRGGRARGGPQPDNGGTYCSSVMASWQLSHTRTANSKPMRGMEERRALHLPHTAFPHLRQWCWGESRGCQAVPATQGTEPPPPAAPCPVLGASRPSSGRAQESPSSQAATGRLPPDFPGEDGAPPHTLGMLCCESV